MAKRPLDAGVSAWRLATRMARVAWVSARYAPALLFGPRLTRPARLRRMVEDLGGAFVKFGQMLASQPDVVAIEYCRELSNLLDRIAPVPFSTIAGVLTEELRTDPAAIFEAIDADPIATASIGQVHTARVAGRTVAIKVQRPEAERAFAADLRLMSGAVAFVQAARVKPWYWLVEPTREFIAWTADELDYRVEARSMEQIRRGAGHPRSRVPEVIWAYTTRRVLVAEYLDGTTVLDYLRALERGDRQVLDALERDGFDARAFASNVVRTFLIDACRHGVFHADPHPANLLILPGNRVGYVDFGITGTLSGYARRHLLLLTLAFARGDVNGIRTAFFKLVAPRADADPARFAEELRRVAPDWYDSRESPAPRPQFPQVDARGHLKKSVTLVMMDLLTLARRTALLPENEIVKYIRSAITLDGLVKRFAPDIDVGRQLEVVCGECQREAAAQAMGAVVWDGLLRAADVLSAVAEPYANRDWDDLVSNPLIAVPAPSPTLWAKRPERRRTDIDEIVAIARASGPTAAAFARYLASRPDVVPFDAAAALALVSDEAPAASLDDVIAREVGRPGPNIFDELVERPFRSALLYQKHRARLPTGERVVVKVLRDDPAAASGNVAALGPLRRALAADVPDEVMDELRADFEVHLRATSDLAAEREALGVLVEDARRLRWLKAPVVHERLTSPRMLTVGDAVTAGPWPEAGRRLWFVWMCQALLGRAFPVDLRAEDAIVSAEGQVGFGSCTFATLPSRSRDQMRDYLMATAAGDPDRALASLLKDMDAAGNADVSGLCRRFRQVLPFRELQTDRGPDDLASHLLIHWRIAREHGWRPRAHVRAFYQGVWHVSGIAGQLSPRSDSMRAALNDVRPVVLRTRFRDLLTGPAGAGSDGAFDPARLFELVRTIQV